MPEKNRNSEFANVREYYDTHPSIGSNIPIILHHGGNGIGRHIAKGNAKRTPWPKDST